jgi:hypothetical protein
MEAGADVGAETGAEAGVETGVEARGPPLEGPWRATGSKNASDP